MTLKETVIDYGKRCAVSISGFPDDAYDIKTPPQALVAITACVSLGVKAHNELNELRAALTKLLQTPSP